MNEGSEGLERDELLALARRDAEAGRVEEALRKLKAAMAEPGALLEASPLAARIYAQLGLTERARTCYLKYLAAHPEALLEAFELGMTYFDKDEPAEAEKLWRGVLERTPRHPPTLFYRALLAAREGRVPDARRDLDVLFQGLPADNLYVTRGRELLQTLDSANTGH